MKHIYTGMSALLLSAALSSTAIASPDNTDLVKAKYLYSHLAFNEAIPYYEKVAGTMNDPEVYAQLGDCYRLVKNPQQAVAYYAKAVTMSGASSLTKLHYAQTLMSLQRYEDAVPWLREYQKEHPEERRVANLIQGAEGARATYARIPEGSVKLMNFNTDGNEFGPVLRQGDLLITADTIIEGRKKTDLWTGSPYYNMYALKCDSLGNCNGEFRKIGANLNTKFHDGPATFSADGKQAFFTRTNFVHRLLMDNAHSDASGVVHLEIMVASGYDNATNKFASIKPFAYNSKNYSTAHPALSPSGNVLVFASDMPGGEGGTDLYICRKDERGNWTSPHNLGKSVNTEGEEMFPYLYDDQTLYFASDGWQGLGGLDMYRSSWNPYDQVFTTPEHLGTPLNSASDDMSMTVSADGSFCYFASNRVAAKGGDNIYMFNRQEVHLALTVVDEFSDRPVSGCTVTLESLQDKRDLTTGSAGSLVTRLYPQSNYMVRLSRQGYEPQSFDLNTISRRTLDTITKFVKMTPNTRIAYRAVILDRDTKLPVEDPWVVLTKTGSDRKPDSVLVPTGASYTGMLETNAEYKISALKPGYYSDDKYISTKGVTPGSDDAIRDTIFMTKLAPKVIIRIENIYYDFNKATIREDAKPSLDRLIGVLEQNPGMTIQLNAHTDCRGSDAYNLKLSKARAASVVKYLTEKGISGSRMESKGYGETAPIEQCDCKQCTEEQYQKNRRTEFQIIKM